MKNFLLFCICIIISAALSAQVITIHHPEAVPVKLERISPAIKNLPQTPISVLEKGTRRKIKDNPSLEHPIPVVNQNALPKGADPALQKVYGQHTIGKEQKTDTAGSGITVLSNWEGMDSNIDPSDNNIAVGPNHILQMTNGSNATYIRIWDKAGNLLAPSTTVESITSSGDIGDPSVIYDEQADRYAFLVIRSSSKLTICISETNDPMGAYYVYSFHTSGGLPDYPKLAVWGNSYFVTTNSNSPTIWAFNRDSLLAGMVLSYAQKFSLSSFPQIGFQSASPVTFTGTVQPPAGDPAIMMRVADEAWGGNIDSDHLELFKVNIDWIDSSQTSITGPIGLGTIAYNSDLCGFGSWNCIPQPNSNTKLDPLGNIIMDKAQYRAFSNHESIVCSHVVNADGDGIAGIRWYELRKQASGDWYIFQQGTYAPADTNYRWMSSISINDKGTISLGYNISSKHTFPGIRVTGRTACDPLGLMTMEEATIQDGSASNNINRYGDYNSVYADPVDGSFWISGQYNPTSNWGTRVAHFTVDACVPTTVTSPVSSNDHLKLAPNPATNRIDVSMISAMDEEGILSVIDISGKIVLQQTLSLHKGDNASALDVHTVKDGFYIVQLKTQEGLMIQNVMIQR